SVEPMLSRIFGLGNFAYASRKFASAWSYDLAWSCLTPSTISACAAVRIAGSGTRIVGSFVICASALASTCSSLISASEGGGGGGGGGEGAGGCAAAALAASSAAARP